ncbi:hypothetical protein [Paenibacillus sp. DRB1-1]|uniref:hypothetical protein n=1 Tax=Paenibacillus sp. DRB1-1 TaxID=3422309 RepID=UPI003F9E4D3D
MITLTIVESGITHNDGEFDWFAPIPTGQTGTLAYIDPETEEDATMDFIAANGGFDEMNILADSDGEYRCSLRTFLHWKNHKHCR